MTGKRILLLVLVVGFVFMVVNSLVAPDLLLQLGALIIGLIPIAFIGLLIWLGVGLKSRQKKRSLNSRSRTVDNLMSQFGPNPETRAANIDKAFDERKGSIQLKLDFIGELRGYSASCTMDRSLISMTARDREALRSVLHLRNAEVHVSNYNTMSQALGIIWGDGKATIYEGWCVDGKRHEGNIEDRIGKGIVGRDGVEPSVNLALKELSLALERDHDHPVLKKLAARLFGTGSDLDPSGALVPSDLTSVPKWGLIIGHDEKDPAKLWTFSGQGSLITVAPPGSGKTQCHVIPNLLTWPGPAVVLDIKGEIFAATSGWRRANVGPVYKFSPLDPGNGHCYNPLLAAAEDPDHIWEDSRFLADMLIVPGGKSKDPFWESRARDILTAAIAVIVRNRPRAERTMGEVLDILHGVGWDRFIISLQASSDVPTMVRSARSLGEMETKTRDSVLQTALASLSAWEGTRITRATAISDWQPMDLRGDTKPTIYICIKPNEIDSYASMLRVIIAQHIRSLASSLPEREAHPILFILDELPRLRHMPPVEEALEIGRGYGLKLWMFSQSLGQLENAYENAEGMIGSCAVRMFMNPSLHDGTAQKLSDDMGYVESVIDGSRVKRVEPNVLGGPTFADKVIVMAANAEPGAIAKHFAHSDPELVARMAIPSAAIAEEPTDAQ